MSRPSVDRVAVIGLGYVGLPLAVRLARSYSVIGYDIDRDRIAALTRNHDSTGEVTAEALLRSTLGLTSEAADCIGADVYIVTVPTPVNGMNHPDLGPLLSATNAVANMLDAARRPTVVFESTVYPGVTEDVCGPALEQASGLVRGRDFFVGYSPERINPGDRDRTIENIVKVVAGENPEITDRLADLYSTVTDAGIFRAASIKTAEAAKVIENAQRDINIAFMNEITQIFTKLGISTLDVIDAAETKWNFLPFRPGLVGGHCIGVDPYYLSHCAQSLGHLPRVILAGRSINDGMGNWLADCVHSRRNSRVGRALVMGLTFKANVPDLRNSRVVDVVRRLRWLGHDVTVHDPIADASIASAEYGIEIDDRALDGQYDVVLGAVAHDTYIQLETAKLGSLLREGGLIADPHGMWRHRDFGEAERWCF